MISLDELEAPMLEIDKDFEAGDKLAGLSYHKTSHNTLGLDGATDFTVFLPWKQWTEKLAYTNISLDKNGDSVLQEAFKHVLADGANKDMCFIDFSHLWDGNELPFFNEGSITTTDKTKSVAKALADVINGVDGDDKQITVRFLIGDREMDTPDRLTKLVEQTFSPDGIPLDCSEDSRPVDFLRSNAGKIRDIRNLIRDNLHVDVPKLEDVASELEKMTDDQARNILGPKKISLSWNHGKILAVNGNSLMTGGVNYAWESASNQYIVVEQSCKLRGDAAVSAHAWMDYFFNYLSKPHKGDTQSFVKVINLADEKKNWKDVHEVIGVDGNKTQPNPAPMSTQAPYNIHTQANEGVKILTCSQLGDWHGKANDLDYPVQIVQLIKDLVMNILWGVLSKTDMVPADESKKKILQQLPIQAIAVTMVDAFFAENAGPREQLAMFLGREVPNPYKFLRINPNAWPSRSTRLRAIANAKKEVILVQQRLILPPTPEELKPEKATADKPQAIVPAINETLNLHDGQSWNGYLWPYDLLLAI